MPDVTPKTESGRAFHEDHGHLTPALARKCEAEEPSFQCGLLRAILAIEQEAASVAVAEVLDPERLAKALLDIAPLRYADSWPDDDPETVGPFAIEEAREIAARLTDPKGETDGD